MNEKIFQITINPTPIKIKPKKDSSELGRIVNGINYLTGVTIYQFSQIVAAPFSYPWYGGIRNGNLTNENWTATSVFALDFDKSDISVSEVIKICSNAEVPPQLWYTTLSHTPQKPRYRVVWFVDTPVNNPMHHKIIYDGMLSLFPQADTKCKNLSRFFFGGNQSTIINLKPTNTQKLLDICSINLISNDKGRNRKIPENLLAFNFGEKRQLLYNSYRNYQISPDSLQNKNTTPIEGSELLFIDWEHARQKVKLLDNFLNGDWLFHDQLFGLATNLLKLKGGRKLMRDTMLKYNQMGLTDYTKNNFNIFTYLNKVNYPPIPIYKFSNFPEDSNIHDIINELTHKRGFIDRISSPINVSLSEAEYSFKTEFKKVLDLKNDKGIYLFNVPTAIGKTELLTNVNATLCFPTHTLKNEVAERMKLDYTLAPDSIQFKNPALNYKLEYYYQTGQYKKATALIYQVAENVGSAINSSDDAFFASEYILQKFNSESTTNSVLTTHSRGINNEYKHDTIVFDEDPLNTLIDIKSFEISDLIKIGSDNPEIKDIMNELLNVKDGIVLTTPKINCDIESFIDKLSGTTIQSNVFGFLNSKFYYKDPYDLNCIHYVVKRELPINKKVIILSATAPVFVYEKLLGNRLSVIDIKNVEQVGEIVQYTNKSCSRNGLNRYCQTISEQVGEKPVITFKGFQNRFKNSISGMYFGNTAGYDIMKGKDLAVVGTPHRNNVEYLLTAAILGINMDNTEMKYQDVEFGDFRFKFNSFSDPDLRNIQFTLIQSDLIQAVGRARTLRTNARVEVFSNFPIYLANKFIF
jgi:hypothetical protein